MNCLPHARGGVSLLFGCAGIAVESSPRTWGCFLISDLHLLICGVFPTHVGVFPVKDVDGEIHVRLPHARGGVSGLYSVPSLLDPSSPRTWGCFLLGGLPSASTPVFPTHVGVFPNSEEASAPARSLPHARGGVSRTPEPC